MNVLVPFTNLHPATEAAVLAAHPTSATYVRTDGHDGYWRSLDEAWRSLYGFIVLEHDKAPEDGLLRALWDCPHDWCSVRTPMRDTDEAAPYPSLSCTKFSGALIRRQPALMADVGELDLGFGAREWSRLDLGVAGLLEGRGETCHWHEGIVEHLHRA